MYTIKETAEVLNISQVDVVELLSEGLLEVKLNRLDVFLGNAKVYIQKTSVESYILRLNK